MSFPYRWPSSTEGFYRPQKGQAPAREPLGCVGCFGDESEARVPKQRMSHVSRFKPISNYFGLGTEESQRAPASISGSSRRAPPSPATSAISSARSVTHASAIGTASSRATRAKTGTTSIREVTAQGSRATGTRGVSLVRGVQSSRATRDATASVSTGSRRLSTSGMTSIRQVTEASPTNLRGTSKALSVTAEKVAGTRDATIPGRSIQTKAESSPGVYGSGSSMSVSDRYEPTAITRAIPSPISQTVAQLSPSKAIHGPRRRRRCLNPNWPIAGIFGEPYGGYAVPWYIRKEPTGLSNYEGYGEIASGASVGKIGGSNASTLSNQIVEAIYSQLISLDKTGLIAPSDLNSTMARKINTALSDEIYPTVAAAGSSQTESEIKSIVESALSNVVSSLGLSSLVSSSMISSIAAKVASSITSVASSSTSSGTSTSTSGTTTRKTWTAADESARKTIASLSTPPARTGNATIDAAIAAIEGAIYMYQANPATYSNLVAAWNNYDDVVDSVEAAASKSAVRRAGASQFKRSTIGSTSASSSTKKSSLAVPLAIGGAAAGLLLLSKFMK